MSTVTGTSSVYEEPSTMYEGSQKSIQSQLNLFVLPPTDVGTLFSGDYAQYFPTISIKENYNPLEFKISSDSNGYLDLKDSYLLLKCRIVLQDGKTCEESDIVAPDVLFFQIMFCNMELYLNRKLITDTSNFYAYKAYIRKHLSSNPIEKQNSLRNEFYYPNIEPDIFSNDPTTGDPGFTMRYEMTKKSKPFTLLGHLDAGLFNQDRYLPSDTDLTINMRRSLPQFCLCAANNEKPSYNGCPYRYDIDKATLFIRRKLIASKIIDEHRKLLAAGNTLKYPMNECEITTYTISKGMISNITDSVLSGRIPKIIVIGFVSSAAFNGELSHSAFNFSSYNMSEISLAVNVQSMEYKTIPFDFKEGDFL